MSEITLRIIEALLLYDLFKVFIGITLRLVHNALQGDQDAE